MYAKQIGGSNNYFYPVGQFSSSGMDGDVIGQYVNPNYQEINSQTAINTEYGKFASGPLIYNVDCSNNYGIRFATSFFRIDATLQGPGSAQPTLNDQIAFSRFFGGNIFQSSSVAISNQTISQCQNYHGQINSINSRLSYSGDYLYNNSDLLYSEPDLIKRINKIAIDGTNNINTLFTQPNKNYPYYSQLANGEGAGSSSPFEFIRLVASDNSGAGPTFTTTFVYGTSQTVVTDGPGLLAMGSPGKYFPSVSPGAVGIIQGAQIYDNSNGRTLTVNSVESFTTGEGENIVLKYRIVCNSTGAYAQYNNILLYSNLRTAGTLISTAYNQGLSRTGQNSISVMFQPPLGIMALTEPLSGSFQITLNPSPDYLYQGIQSSANTLTAGTDYRLIINNVRFYANMVRMTFSPERSIKLRLMDIEMYNKPLNGQNNTYQITVPPSSRAFAICFQSNNAGRNGALSLSPSEFRSLNGLTSQLKSLQCTYGSISIPSTNYQTDENNDVTVAENKVISYTGGNEGSVNTMVVRYFDYLATTGKIFSESAAEKFEDWIQSPIYIFDFSNSENSRSTNLDISVNFRQPLDSSTNLLCAAFFSRVCTGTYRANILSELNIGNI